MNVQAAQRIDLTCDAMLKRSEALSEFSDTAVTAITVRRDRVVALINYVWETVLREIGQGSGESAAPVCQKKEKRNRKIFASRGVVTKTPTIGNKPIP